MNLNYFILLVCFALNFLIFFYLKWYIKRRTSSSGLMPEYRTEVHRLIAEIDAVTDRDSLLVEERIKKLKEILDDTDRRISVYVKELEKSRAGSELYTNLGRGIRAALKTETEAKPQLSVVHPNMELFHSASESQPVPAVKAPPADAERKNTPPQATKQKPPSKQIRTSIDLLLNEGLPPEEIASRLDISVAAVNFAMNFQRKKK